MFDKSQRSTFPYWFAHWCAYNMTALNCGKWRFKYLFHDLEKPFIKLFFEYPKVQKFHRSHNRHHVEWLEKKLNKAQTTEDALKILNKFDFEGAVIDWECARFTKSEQPRDAAKEFVYMFYSKAFPEKFPNVVSKVYNEFRDRSIETMKYMGVYHE